jgi:hypothetical protein
MARKFIHAIVFISALTTQVLAAGMMKPSPTTSTTVFVPPGAKFCEACASCPTITDPKARAQCVASACKKYPDNVVIAAEKGITNVVNGNPILDLTTWT